MRAIRELLRSAAEAKELVTLAYNGGSHPGQPRKVVPLSLQLDELVAVEPGARASKHYKLFKIAWVELPNGERADNTDVDPVPPSADGPALPTLREYTERYLPELIKDGWHVVHTDISIGLATYFKNGKPRKTPTISIQYLDPAAQTDLLFDPDKGELIDLPHDFTGRERPWRVDSWRFKQGKSFAVLRKAFELFITEARAGLPPSR